MVGREWFYLKLRQRSINVESTPVTLVQRWLGIIPGCTTCCLSRWRQGGQGHSAWLWSDRPPDKLFLPKWPQWVPQHDCHPQGSNTLVLNVASLGDGTADTDGWLKMTVQWWWFQTHCSEIRAHLKRGSPCPFLWWLVAQTAVSLWFSSPGSSSLGLTWQCFVQSPTSPGEKREAL